jgi:hypothetical protein
VKHDRVILMCPVLPLTERAVDTRSRPEQWGKYG